MTTIWVNISLEIYSITLSFILVYCLFMGKNLKDRMNRLFIWMLITNMGVLTCDLLTWIFSGNTEPFVRPILLIANFGVYSLGYVFLALFTDYLVSYISVKVEISGHIVKIISCMCMVAIVLVIISQFNHMYYYYDETNEYQRNSWYWLSQIWAVIILFIDGFIVLKYRRQLTSGDVFALLSYEILPILAMLIQVKIYGITLLYVATTLSMLIIYVNIQVQQEKRLNEKEIELMDSRVSTMMSQIRPHFIHNVLVVIRNLCDKDVEQAKEAVVEFSDFLRGSMDALSRKRLIPFEQEMHHVENYLKLEKRRFGNRLQIQYNVIADDFLLPALTVQPIVENAVRYGAAQRADDGTVSISTQETEEGFVIKVWDNGRGFDPAMPINDGRSHIGIDNVRRRLSAMCGGVLNINSNREEGTTVIITIPKTMDKKSRR